MNKNLWIGIALIGVVGVGYLLYAQWQGKNAFTNCPLDAKVCPDGTMVGRSWPNCSFAECPPTDGYATIKGVVVLGPVCPVETNPPDPNCAAKEYQTIVSVRSSNGTVVSVPTDEHGAYLIKVRPGSYMIAAASGAPLPLCKETSVTVSANETKMLTLSCDTGIR